MPAKLPGIKRPTASTKLNVTQSKKTGEAVKAVIRVIRPTTASILKKPLGPKKPTVVKKPILMKPTANKNTGKPAGPPGPGTNFLLGKPNPVPAIRKPGLVRGKPKPANKLTVKAPAIKKPGLVRGKPKPASKLTVKAPAIQKPGLVRGKPKPTSKLTVKAPAIQKSKPAVSARKQGQTVKKPKVLRIINQMTVGKKFQVFQGRRDRTIGGNLAKDLMRNKWRKIVSKRKHKIGKGNAWIKALMKARKVMKIEGFATCPKGSALYEMALGFYQSGK